MTSKYLLIASDLYGRFPQMLNTGIHKLPSEAQLCREYNCSRQTIRAALEFLQKQNLIIKKSGSGSYIREGKIGRIALLLPSLNEYIFPEILRSITSFFADYHFDVIAYSAHSNEFTEREILKSLLQDPPDGIIIEPAKGTLPCISTDLFRQFEDLHIPIVFMQGIYKEFPDYSFVVSDERIGLDKLTNLLVTKRCRRIFSLWMENNVRGAARYSALAFSCLDRGLKLQSSDTLWISLSQYEKIINGDYTLFDELDFSLTDGKFAVIAQNDEWLYHLTKYLARKGLQIQKDYLAVGFDNSYYTTLTEVPLTSIGLTESLGKACAQALLRQLTGGRPKSRLLATDLFIRQSTD